MSNQKHWTKKDGRKIRICDMTTVHILNTMLMLERRHVESILEMPFPSFQGEMAQYYAEQEWTAAQDEDVSDAFPIYLDMHEELVRRKVDGMLVVMRAQR